MDKLLEHLEKTVEDHKKAWGIDIGHQLMLFVESFQMGKPAAGEQYQCQLAYPRVLILDAMVRLLQQQRFDLGKGADYARGRLTARLEGKYDAAGGWIAAVPKRSGHLHLTFEVSIAVAEDGAVRLETTRRLPTWVQEFQDELRRYLQVTPPDLIKLVHDTSQAATEEDRILGPGEKLPGPSWSVALDYSGCATQDEVAELHRASGGTLPLGKWAFGMQGKAVDYGEMLYLAPDPVTRARREDRGTLICAPQNSGKTELILRWARAANHAGYNLFLIDVKGNLYSKLRDEGWQGELYYLSTNPREEAAGPATRLSDAVNFLEGLDGSTPAGSMRIRQLAEALLPGEGYGEGEGLRHRIYDVGWLTAMIHLVLLDGVYYPYEERPRDLSDVYDLASNEMELLACLERLDQAETANEQEGNAPLAPGLDALFNEIAALVPPMEFPSEDASTPAQVGLPRADANKPPLLGERAEHTYRWLTEHIVNALRPFGRHGTLYDKVSGFATRPHFQLEWLAGFEADGSPSRRQVTVLLAARVQDLGDAETLLAIAITRLQHALFDRMELLARLDEAQQAQVRPVLLLLDETRRIRNFKTNEYVAFAREARAGCVVAYQSLDQIGSERQIMELIENVGTQIYLGGLVGNTAKYFSEIVRKRRRPTYARTASIGSEGASQSVQTGQELVVELTPAELYALPAGRYPALVYLNDQPRRKPILVTMDRAVTGL
jgi:hypothetical protein